VGGIVRRGKKEDIRSVEAILRLLAAKKPGWEL
jgi:hypothetical protein